MSERIIMQASEFIDEVIRPKPRKLPKHFRDLFIDRKTKRISPNILFRSDKRGRKGILRKPIREVFEQHPHIGVFDAMRAFTPYGVEIDYNMLSTPDDKDGISALFHYLENNTSESWFYWFKQRSHQIGFESLNDAVACRMRLGV